MNEGFPKGAQPAPERGISKLDSAEVDPKSREPKQLSEHELEALKKQIDEDRKETIQDMAKLPGSPFTHSDLDAFRLHWNGTVPGPDVSPDEVGGKAYVHAFLAWVAAGRPEASPFISEGWAADRWESERGA